MSSRRVRQVRTAELNGQPDNSASDLLQTIDSDDLSSLSSEDEWHSDELLGSESDDSVHLEEESSVYNANPEENTDSDTQPRKRMRSGTVWPWVPDSNFFPSQPAFESSHSGLTTSHNIPENPQELDYFEEFIDNDVINLIVTQTNSYYEFIKENHTFKQNSRLSTFKNTDADEIRLFLCIILLMGHTKKNRINDYWGTNEVFEQKIFGKLMSRDRFLQLLRLLHFSNNNNDKTSKIEKIKPILDVMRTKFKSKFIPFKDLCIDESLLLWRGRLHFRQYIPSKRHKFGVKTFVLCDCKTGYVLDLIIYTGNGTEIAMDPDVGMTGSVVMTLLQPFLNKGHVLYVDNWYTSPALFVKLLENKTGACGTVRQNRKNMPKLKNLKKGEVTSVCCNKILCVKWCDKRNVQLLTSVHEDQMCDSGKKDRDDEIVMKPKCVIEYNKKMRLVDKSDMLISGIECVRKTIRWYKKFFFHLIDLSMLNAYYVYKERNIGEKKALLDFSSSVIVQMIEKYKCKNDRISIGHIGNRPSRLIGRHFMKPLSSRRTCHVCSKTTKGKTKYQRTNYICEECEVPLCVHPCFKKYHTEKNF